MPSPTIKVLSILVACSVIFASLPFALGPTIALASQGTEPSPPPEYFDPAHCPSPDMDIQTVLDSARPFFDDKTGALLDPSRLTTTEMDEYLPTAQSALSGSLLQFFVALMSCFSSRDHLGVYAMATPEYIVSS